MSAAKRYLPFFASALLMVLLLLIIYPHFRYYIDPDGVAYLTIASRYAAGHLAAAINGYWSPWACWLTALLMHTCALPAIPASVVVNSLAAIGYLYIAQSFFLRFTIGRTLQWLLCAALALFLCFAVFWQSFDDLWECFFLLSALRIMLAGNFLHRPLLWAAMGLAGALAYFAKAYSFPFFMLSTLCCVYLVTKKDKAATLKISSVAILVMIACACPWIWLLHGKYGIWTTSTAGPLNTSWYLVGHPIYKQGIGGLLPPPYADSPYFWEDPYTVNGAAPHFWSSWYLLGRQALKIIQNICKLLVSCLQLSVFFPAIGFAAWLLLTAKKIKQSFPADVSIVALSFLLFPLGYILVNFESRYIWYMLPLGMVMGALVIPQFSRSVWIYAACAATFLLYPAWGMYNMCSEGSTEYAWARQLQLRNIQGSFTAIAAPGIQAQRIERLAYFSGNSYYYIKDQHITGAQLLAEMKYHKIHYIYMSAYTQSRMAAILQQYSAAGLLLRETAIGELKGLKVYELKY